MKIESVFLNLVDAGLMAKKIDRVRYLVDAYKKVSSQ